MTYFIKTFGCAANTADSQRIASFLEQKTMKPARSLKSADYIVINTCMVRASAENRIYGLLNNLEKYRHSGRVQNHPKIILTGCLVGLAVNDKTGKVFKRLREKFPMVDEFLPISEVGFDYPQLRQDKITAIVPISHGCNNFCSYCVVPFTRGREVPRPYGDIINECKSLKGQKFKKILLVGQNVNSYGADFPKLLEEVAKMGFAKVDFMSSNPWDFSDELIAVIAGNKNITRDIHLPVQSGDNEILRRMNRRYTRKQYLNLISRIKNRVKDIRLSTDIIVGFPGETEEQFQNTVDLCLKVGFYKAYISEYSPRPLTAASKIYPDDIPPKEKKRRWQILENSINRHE